MIRLIQPIIDYSLIENDFKEIFASGIFTKGNHVRDLQNEFSSFLNIKYAFSTTSATTALTTALVALNIKPKDEVIVANFSFPASANVVECLGAKAKLIDVRRDTFNMEPQALAASITKKTKAVIFVAAFGNPTGITEIAQICKKFKIPLIEDAACGLGSMENKISCGAFGTVGCFSFHPRKLVTAGEGGMIVTKNTSLSKKINILLAHGSKTKGLKTKFYQAGYNFRLTELQAVMIKAQLPLLKDVINFRNYFRSETNAGLKQLGFKAQLIGENALSNIQSLVFTVPPKVNRDNLILRLRKIGIETTIGTYSISDQPYYKRKYGLNLSNSTFLQNNTITLPCHQLVEPQEIILAIKNSL